jgi:hypothetical protein
MRFSLSCVLSRHPRPEKSKIPRLTRRHIMSQKPAAPGQNVKDRVSGCIRLRPATDTRTRTWPARALGPHAHLAIHAQGPHRHPPDACGRGLLYLRRFYAIPEATRKIMYPITHLDRTVCEPRGHGVPHVLRWRWCCPSALDVGFQWLAGHNAHCPRP